MSAFELIELSFDPEDSKPTLEDLEKLENPEHLQIASKQLLKIILHKQGMIRALCKRLVELETGQNVTRVHFKGKWEIERQTK